MMDRASQTLKVTYYGFAVDDGTMDVRELAPALLSLGKLFEEAALVTKLNADGAISVRIRHFERGSFGISVEVVQGIAAQFVDFFSGKPMSAVENLLGIIGFVSGVSTGLWQLIKKAKGRKPSRASRLEDGRVRLEFDEETITVDERVVMLYRNANVRSALAGVVQPLFVEGINRVGIAAGANEEEDALKEEGKYFMVPELEDSLLLEEERVAIFSIHSLSFKEDNKWRLSDGANTFFVLISDNDFLRSVDANTSFFAKGDRLKVKMKIKTWETSGGIRTDYEAVKIIEHLKSARQIPLLFE